MLPVPSDELLELVFPDSLEPPLVPLRVQTFPPSKDPDFPSPLEPDFPVPRVPDFDSPLEPADPLTCRPPLPSLRLFAGGLIFRGPQTAGVFPLLQDISEKKKRNYALLG